MKKYIFFFFFSFAYCLLPIAYSQDVQVPNGGFENWSYSSYYQNPSGYFTPNPFAFNALGVSVSKVQGFNSKYAVKLQSNFITGSLKSAYIYYGNKYENILINHYGGIPFNQTPKYFRGNFKFNCNKGDSANILLYFKKNGIVVGINNFKLGGIKNNFIDTTFLLREFKDAPDTAWIGFTSGSLQNPTYGNWLVIDNISFPDINYQIPNGNFETWDSTGIFVPQPWNTSLQVINYHPNTYSCKTTDAHSGSYAMQITTKIDSINTFAGPVVSYITTGDFNFINIIDSTKDQITNGGFAVNSNPDSIEFYYKYNNSKDTIDTALFIVDFSKYYNNVHYSMGRFIAKLPPAASYKSKILKFFIGNPNLPSDAQVADSANIIISSSNYLALTNGQLKNCIGNTLKIDDLQFWYKNMTKGYGISGNVTYDNVKVPNTPLTNLKLYLKNSQNKIIDSTTTNSSGYYQFPNKEMSGSYTISVICTKSHYKPNPTDALKINRSYIGTYKIATSMRKLASDVDKSGKINPSDALAVNRFYIGKITVFKIPFWLFESPAININSTDIIINFKGICAADIAGSFTPPL